ncbi:MAG: hypothetical protein J6K16_06360 [Alphaproteobacteria bacterium]|nr:hypothetical protein [Alphaproteobacteria bacterium]
MTKEKLEQAIAEIKNHREEIITRLVQFSKTDSLLFWDKEVSLYEKQEELWGPILKWAHHNLNAKYMTTDKMEVVEQKKNTLQGLKKFLETMTDKELAAFYLASINMKSELLAAALVRGFINAETAYNAAYLEEISQAERWGKDENAEQKRQALKKELVDIENFLK